MGDRDPMGIQTELHQLVDQLPKESFRKAEEVLRRLCEGVVVKAGGSPKFPYPPDEIDLLTRPWPIEEKARRVFIFARYEARAMGANAITPEHLLLGLLREDKPLAHRFLTAEAIRDLRLEIQRQTQGPQCSASVDLPLSESAREVWRLAATEAGRLNQRVATAHIFVGLILAEPTLANAVLERQGIKLSDVRAALEQAS
jgi:hypothetical protein